MCNKLLVYIINHIASFLNLGTLTFTLFKYRQKPMKGVVMLNFLSSQRKWSETQVPSKLGKKKNVVGFLQLQYQPHLFLILCNINDHNCNFM